MRKKMVGIVVLMLVITIGSVSGITNQTNDISYQEAGALYIQPFSIQFHLKRTPIVQPIEKELLQNQKSGSVGTDTKVTTFTEADTHPCVEIDNDGNPMVVYDHDTGLGYHEIYLQRSLDGGKTWPADKRYYLAGNESTSVINPVLELVDNGTRAIVLFQVETLDPRFLSIDLHDIDDPATWVLYSGENASVNPWVGQQAVDMVGDHIGVQSYIAHMIWGAYDCNSTFCLFWTTDLDNASAGQGMFFYYPTPDTGYWYCHPTAAAGTQYLYGAAQYHLPTGKHQIVVTWCSLENLTFEHWEYYFIPLYTSTNMTNPNFAASGQYAYLAAQTTEKGNEDIVCFTPPSPGQGWWKKHVVVNSSDDEMYPSITAVGLTVLCTFMKNGSLYMVKSIDGGVTWGVPEKISDPAAQVIMEYRSAHVQGPYSVWMDNRDANSDIYADVLTMPWIAFTKCSGGLGCSVEIANVGTGDAMDIEWNVHVGGGMTGLINKTANGTIDITVGKTGKVKSGLFFGLGKIFMTATIGGCEVEREGKHLLIFSLIR